MTPFPAPVTIIANLLIILLILYALCRVNYRRMQKYPETLNVFFAACLVLTLIAYLRAGVLPGLELHLFGAVACTLVMGWPLALLAMALAHSLNLILHPAPPAHLGLTILIHAALPIAFCHFFDRLVIKKLPHNPFIFVLGSAFLGGALSIVIATLAAALLYRLLGIYSWQQLWDKYLMFMPLFAYPEGFINGTFIASMVAFFPRWLSHFDEQSYFKIN